MVWLDFSLVQLKNKHKNQKKMSDIDREMESYEMENNFHLQSNFDNASTSITSVIDNVLQAVILGKVNPLDAFVVFKELEKKFNDAKKSIDSMAYEEAEKYGKNFVRNNRKFTLIEGRKSFDFKNINEWIIAKESLVQIENKYKSVYENNKNGISSLNEETGEVLAIPTVTFSKSSITVK
jgi:hypothetical protein